MKKFLLILILAMLTGPVLAAAWTENKTTVGILSLVPADATTSYDSSTNFANGMYISSIGFMPSQAGDKLVVRNGSATGAKIANFYSVDGGPQIKYFSGERVYRPYILYTDNTIGGTATNVVVTIEYRSRP